MKCRHLSLFFFVCFSLQSFAVLTADSSWLEIRSSHKVLADFPPVTFKNGSSITIDELCIEGTHVRPLQANRLLCTQFAADGDSYRCVKTKALGLSSPLTISQNICLEFSENGFCTSTAVRKVNHARKYIVNVYSLEADGSLSSAPLFSKPFKIPACP